jgi:cellulose synthase/poly-beta-1,6-N-acetylglucosamine synthase-like glycosyltransferase
VTLLFLLLVGVILYVCVATVIAGGIHSRYKRRLDHPTVSVVIPARNEEQTISDLLESLLDVDYPSEQLEVVLVNDQSTDRTREIAEGFQGRFRCRFEIFDVEPEQNSSLRAKTRPLAQGIDRAHGEFVLMPDADNRVPRNWVKCMISFFADDVGMVCGTTLPDPHRQSRQLLTALETVDAALLLGTCAGFSGLDKTQALIGSNFAVRRSAYEQIGTYRSLDYHEIEDLALLHALQATGKWKAVFPAEGDTLLLTMPHRSLLDLIHQRRRWMGGWHRLKPAIRAALTIAIVAHIVWPLLLLVPLSWFFGLYGLLVFGDSLVAAQMLHRYRRTRFIPLLLFYPVFAAVYAVPLLLLMATRREVKWKERAY